jgi:hypothetical protein
VITIVDPKRARHSLDVKSRLRKTAAPATLELMKKIEATKVLRTPHAKSHGGSGGERSAKALKAKIADIPITPSSSEEERRVEEEAKQSGPRRRRAR